MSHERPSPNTVLIVSNDVVDVHMAGPGIRCWELAKVLAVDLNVILAAPEPTSLEHPQVRVVTYRPAATQSLEELVDDVDIVVTDAWGLDNFSTLPDDVYVVIDLYDPFLLENLELFRRKPARERNRLTQHHQQFTETALRRGDFFICASERQRDFWLGALMLAGRVTPATYDSDRTLENLIGVVPFGLPAEPPAPTGPFLRDRHPNIKEGDRIILWGGGIWEWLDPLTLIRAMARIINTHPEAKLVFPGTKHPNPGMPQMQMREDAMRLADDLELRDRHVFFGDWVPYTERADYLCEADIGVSLHHAHVETRMAFRTRFLDYVWAHLPMVVSHGDTTADLVERWELGRVVPCEDVDAVAGALLELLEMPALETHYRSAFEQAAHELTWERTARPLTTYCTAPYKAADADRPDMAYRPRSDIIATLNETRAEVEHVHSKVRAYERGRFIRTMKLWHSWQHQIRRWTPIRQVRDILLALSTRMRRLLR